MSGRLRTSSALRMTGSLDPRIVPMALRQIEAHLAKLEAEGRVRRVGEEWALS